MPAAQVYNQLKKTPQAADTSLQGFVNNLSLPSWLQPSAAPPAVVPSMPIGAANMTQQPGSFQLPDWVSAFLSPEGIPIAPAGGRDWYQNFLGNFIGDEQAKTTLDDLSRFGTGGEVDAISGAQPFAKSPIDLSTLGGGSTSSVGIPSPFSHPSEKLSSPDLMGYAQSAFGTPPQPPSLPSLTDNGVSDILMGLAAGGPLPNGPHQLGSLLMQVGLSALTGTEAAARQNKATMDKYYADMSQYQANNSEFERQRQEALATASQQEFMNKLRLQEMDDTAQWRSAQLQAKGKPDATPILRQLATMDPNGMMEALAATDPTLVTDVIQAMGADLGVLQGAGLSSDMNQTILASKVLNAIQVDAQTNPETAQILAYAEAMAQARALMK